MCTVQIGGLTAVEFITAVAAATVAITSVIVRHALARGASELSS